MKIEAKFLRLLKDESDNDFEVTFSTKDTFLKAFLNEVKNDVLDVEIKKHKNQRSLDANAYFHLLVTEIAKKRYEGKGTAVSIDEVKRDLVTQYGSLAVDENGKKVGIKIPASVNVYDFLKYPKKFDERVENGVTFNCYLVFKETHTLDSAEMARLIDGTVQEAQALGIETRTPAELEILKNTWEG